MIVQKVSFLQKTWVVAAIAFLCSALWGSAFAGVKIGYQQLQIASDDWASQMIFAGIRFTIAGGMAWAAGSFFSKKLLLPTRKNVPKIGTLSLFQTILQYFFYYIGLAHTTGVKASIIVASNVFIAILLSTLVYRLEKLQFEKWIGCIIGFSGIILCNLNGLQGGIQFSFIGDGFIFLCTIASGFSSVLMKKYGTKENPVLLSSWQFLFGGLILWGIGVLFGGKMGTISISSMIIILYLSFVSAAAYSLWAMLLKYNPVSKVTVFGFLNPICGVVISAIVLKEYDTISILNFIALLMVCIGIYLVNRQKKSVFKNKIKEYSK